MRHTNRHEDTKDECGCMVDETKVMKSGSVYRTITGKKGRVCKSKYMQVYESKG
ncbi:MAG TPA: hypothetical protein PK767_00540 [Clostridiales bacterium]|nr:hypothetical protein [Clostridiales bacterium]HOL90909.1 hypothetical protein [Clostridiales bacterium]HPP34714.1 hypothetical protein [Clostridiales bacterium]